MRVAFLAPSAPARSAVGNLLAERVAFFQGRGDEVRVLLESIEGLHPSLAAVADLCPVVENLGPVWESLRRNDIVFFEVSQGCSLLDFLPALVDERPRCIANYYGISPSDGWPGPQRELLDRGRRSLGLLWFADAVVVHSRASADELVKEIGLPRERIHQLPVPIDVARWAPGPQKHRSKNPVLLYVGRIAPNKRTPLLIEALAHLPGVEAWIVGNTGDVYAEQVRQAQALAERLGVAGRVRWLGDIPEESLPGLYHQADVLVLPSIHEGLGIPVLEAQAAGLPVVAARAAALPETVAEAGLTFRPDDVRDLVRQIQKVLASISPAPLPGGERDAPPRKRRVAIVAFRYGEGFIGGAESSLRTIVRTLHNRGHSVEIYTTCTVREYDWKNDLPVGDLLVDGIPVHRFMIDPHHRSRHDQACLAIVQNDGRVSPEIEAEYLAHSIQSPGLIAALETAKPDAIVCGPYLHTLPYKVARAFPEKTFLMPCWHEEPYARLAAFVRAYGDIAGVFFHTPEEQELAQAVLGHNHPGGFVVGTTLKRVPPVNSTRTTGTLVYCGRYVDGKNVPLLLELAAREEARNPGKWRWVFVGEGHVPLPKVPWLTDLGRVDDAEKHRAIAGADALVQLSTNESLSLVVLEAWQLGVPVIVHRDSPVLRGQVQRSGGGVCATAETFGAVLDDLANNPDDWKNRGSAGRRYVETNYLDADAFGARLEAVMDHAELPLAEQMRRRGLERIRGWDRAVWRERFDRFVSLCLEAADRVHRRDIELEPVSPELAVSPRQAALLVPVRVHNRGTLPVVAEGPSASRIEATLTSETGTRAAEPAPMPDMILPGRAGLVLAPIQLPRREGRFEATFRMGSATATVSITAGENGAIVAGGGVGPLLDAAQAAIAAAHARQALPRDYLDVTEGRFARAKRWIKAKLLHNFKLGYVDVMSAQQSDVNRRLVEAMQHLSECCRALDQTVRVLQDRLAESDAASEKPLTRDH